MGRKRISDDEYEKRIRSIMAVIRAESIDNKTVDKVKISELTGLTVGQVGTAIKKQRRLYLKRPQLVKNGYIVSTSKGYKLSATNEDYLNMYKTLYGWATSVLLTIEPVNEYLEGQGVDMKAVQNDVRAGNNNVDDFDEHWLS